MKKHLFIYKYRHEINGGFNDLIEKFGDGMVNHGDEVYILSDDTFYKGKGLVKAKGFKIYYSSLRNIWKLIRMKFHSICICEPFRHYLIWAMWFKSFKPSLVLNIYLCGSKTEQRSVIDEFVFKIAQRLIINNFIPCTFYSRDKALRNKKIAARAKIIYCPVDIHQYKKTTGLNGKKLLAIDRLRKRKNYIEMVEAFKVVHDKDPEITLDVGGSYRKIDDPTKNKDYAEKVFALVKKYGLEDAITFHGSLTEEEKIKMLSEATIFLKTSHNEMQGIIATEAVASGLPVVAFDNSGTHEVVKDAGGILVEDRNPEAMAKEILALIDDKPRLKAISEQSMESAKKYSFENNIEYFYKTATKKES
jgi:glycosyltransferase involved in cell wall biosynthesis